MFNRGFLKFFLIVLLTFTVIPITAQANDDVGTFAIPGPNYPGTSIEMKVGDVLYSTKTFGTSSQIVGHVGIVGPDYLIYHVSPIIDSNGNGAGDSISTYMSRHGQGETLQIYKYKYSTGLGAAQWAKNNYMYATEYAVVNPFHYLSTIDPNYCSKFIWQAFYYGDGVDVTGKGLTGSTWGTWVYPSNFTNSNFAWSGQFTT
ncbi:hypothetical protein GC098_35775 [Paenibacillus sp. LMG 31458]|uniref:Hydrolase n=1 Tax=Paenibacillus phytorum TaxID=2654977 RepID=A0ABX1Y796_9BACL|nr:hypothetical protein [Paenibacillus phytorum]NOU76661.1 hypothetical protein [Paenibacillus phytorum]